MASSVPQVSESHRQRLSGVRKAAIFLVAVGDELGRKILQNLAEPDVQRLTEQIAELRSIPPEVSLEVIEEFHEMLETQQYMMHGGLDYASKLLVDTFGKQRAEDLLNLVKRAQEASQSDLAMLEKVDPQQLGKFLESEHPADHCHRSGSSGCPSRIDRDRQPQRGTARGGDSPARGHAAVFSGDGAAGGHGPASPSGEHGGDRSEGLLGLQGGGRPAQSHGIANRRTACCRRLRRPIRPWRSASAT